MHITKRAALLGAVVAAILAALVGAAAGTSASKATAPTTPANAPLPPWTIPQPSGKGPTVWLKRPLEPTAIRSCGATECPVTPICARSTPRRS